MRQTFDAVLIFQGLYRSTGDLRCSSKIQIRPVAPFAYEGRS
jgi:hypothetical protein